MPAPMIGITTSNIIREMTRTRWAAIPKSYSQAVIQAGGMPVLIPTNMPLDKLDDLISRLDGVILAGGGDIDPARFGGEMHEKVKNIIPERDEIEIQLVTKVIEVGKPFLGICRGLQVINVVLGGTLYQDLPSQFDGDVLKHRQTTPKWQATHEVEVRDGSYLAEVAGRGVVKVNSYHHQGIKGLADGLVVSARSADGVIEAIEGTDLPGHWLVGVQWHAEAMRGASRQQRALFEAHVSAAEHHARRQAAA